MQNFCRAGEDVFKYYIDYLDREETHRNNAIQTYNLYHDYMGNPLKTTGLFTQEKDTISFAEKKELKDLFQQAQDNGSVMWQTVISFDNRWLEKNGLYDSEKGFIDERKLKEVARMSINRLLEKEGLELAVWSAAIHYNTDNIHVHVATVEPNPTRQLTKYQGQWEVKGKFKQRNLEECKSCVVNEIMQTREMNILINRIIRKDIVKAKEERKLAEDKDIRKKFLTLYENLPSVSKNLINYNNSIMSAQRGLIDEISFMYLEKYHAKEYQEFKEIINRQSDLYSEAYGVGKTDRSYAEGKMADLLERLGNAILKEVKGYENKINKQVSFYQRSITNSNMVKLDDTLVKEDTVISESEKEKASLDLTPPTELKVYSADIQTEIEKMEEFWKGGKQSKGWQHKDKAITHEEKKKQEEYKENFDQLKELRTQLNPQKGEELDIDKIESAAAKENELAEYQLGKTYLNKELEAFDLQKGILHMDKAMNHGNQQAKYALGCEYLEPESAAYDKEKGLRYINEMAEEGNSFAQLKLGMEYLKGHNVPRNIEMAREWLTKSAEQENEFAGKLLKDIEINGISQRRGRGLGQLDMALRALQRSMDEEHRKTMQLVNQYRMEQEIDMVNEL